MRAVVLALAGLVLAGPLSTGVRAASPAPRPRQSVAPIRCPAGMTTLDLAMGPRCIHTIGDAAPPLVPKGARPSAAIPPKCYGNGVNGSRIHLIYGYLSGRASRAAAIVPKIVNEWVPQMEATFRTTSRQQGRELGLRFWAPDCRIAVDVEEIPFALGEAGDIASPAGPNRAQFGNVVNHLYKAGYDDSSKKYLIWLDEISYSACGIGSLFPIDVPTAVNPNNGNPEGLVGANTAIGFVQMGVVFGQGCWGKGRPGAFVETHELLHTLGAVQTGAPNSNGAGHCNDDFDIMCYPDPKAPKGKQKTHPRCSLPVAALDCGSDDYFRVNPNPGTYLATHHNVADSRFLGDALAVDAVPLALPRP